MIFANKVRNLYSYLQALVLIAGLIWTYISPVKHGPPNMMLYLLVCYSLLILILRWLQKAKAFNTDNLILVGQLTEALIIMLLIRFSGKIDSQFYLAYFPLIVFISMYSRKWRAILGIVWYGACFILATYSGDLGLGFWQTVVIRLSAIWTVGFISFSIAHYMKSSENKLLKTLDVLNERTWELESSQSQLSSIYETTRALSGILNLEELLGEILRVAQNNFRFKHCNIYLTKLGHDELYLYASLDNENRHIYEKPEPYNRDIKDLVDLQDTGSISRRLSEDANSGGKRNIDIPMISRGKVIGIMQVRSEGGLQISSRERKLLMIFAHSSAVAIDNSLLYKQTQELTITDELTELFNYRYFRTRLSEELRRSDRYRQKLSILMLDIDHFKRVNDENGHITGNLILREVAAIISQCVRDVDVVARYGGEEFTVILPQTDKEDASIIAERIRETVEKNYFQNNKGRRDIQLTISIGGCTYPDGIHTLEQLLEKVDTALYQAKAEGRNVVIFAGREQKRTTEFIG